MSGSDLLGDRDENAIDCEVGENAGEETYEVESDRDVDEHIQIFCINQSK